MTTIGQRLTSERERIGLNQTKFGEIGGVTKGTQINYEGDKRTPCAGYLKAIAEKNADIQYIITGKHSNTDQTGTTTAKANTLDRELLVDIMEGLEDNLKEKCVTLDIKTKAKLITILYEHFRQKNTAVDAVTVGSFLKLVA